jgi:hypothetical protein
LIVYALSRDVVMAIGAVFLIFFTRAAEFGVVYPIWFMGTVHTYGVLGLSTIILAVGLLGAGCQRSAGFLLGVAPAIHPSLGVWVTLVVALALIWDFHALREQFRPAVKWFLAGWCVTAVSIAVQLLFVYGGARADQPLAEDYFAAFVAFWDGHRRPVTFHEPGVMLNVSALTLAIVWLSAFSADLSRSARFLLRVVVVTAAVSLALIVVSWIPPDRLPLWLLMLMPSRLLNFNAGVFVALLIGLIGASRPRLWSPVLMLLLAVGLVLSDGSMLRDLIARNRLAAVARAIIPAESPTTTLQILMTAGLVLIVCRGVSAWRERSRRSADAAPTSFAPALVAGTVVRSAIVGILVWVGVTIWQESRSHSTIFLDRMNSPLFMRAAQGQGLLLTGGDLHLIQLRTRRPVILDGGALDTLVYAIDSAPEMQRILQDIYGIDLRNPPEEARGLGAIPNDINQKTWEGYPREKWQEIRRSYDVRHVLTPHWVLTLPVIDWNRTLLLYEIPAD